MKFEFAKETNTVMFEDGRILTKEEFDETCFICDDCGEAFEIDRDSALWEYRGNKYCDNCADERDLVRCKVCGEVIDTNDCDTVTADDTGSYAHYDCASSDWYRCSECGDWYERSNHLFWSQRRDSYFCEYCWEQVGPDLSERIGDYHDFKCSGDYEFFGDEERTSVPYLGFELEVDHGSNEDDALDSAEENAPENFFHFENDGSLENGFEIISQPASINWHVHNADNYAKAWGGIVRAGYESHNAKTCGLHVHVDRKFFKDCEDSAIAKIVFLMERHWDNFVKFSRRRESQLHWCSRYGTTPSDVVKMAKEHRHGRYYALNLTNNNTIEFRLWRGTLNPSTFMATIKFTARICELAKNARAVDLVKMSWDEILGDDEDIKNYWTSRNRTADNQ